LFLDVRSSFRFSFLDKRIPRYTCPALPYHHVVSSRLDLSSFAMLCYQTKGCISFTVMDFTFVMGTLFIQYPIQ
jgi:hypothetical protein